MGVLTQQITDRWAIYNGDCIEVMAELPTGSIHGSVYSPPFAGLYHYSSDDRDLSNARTYGEFAAHYGYVLDEITRLTMPGRTTAVHAAPVPSGNSGRDSLHDFPGDVIRWHQDRGWDWIARHLIWKEPLAVRLRTMQKNLAHKTLCDDAAAAGVASGDELLVFRKPGAHTPIAHPNGLLDYAGSEQPPTELARFRGWDGKQTGNRWSQWIWRRYASCIWDDIRIDRVLPFRDSNVRASNSFVVPWERHTRNSGVSGLTDPRDLYENNANMGARRMREAIFSVIPKWVSEQAEAWCHDTLQRGDSDKPFPQLVSEVIKAFESKRVTRAMLEAKIGRASGAWLPADVATLRVVWTSLERGEVAIGDEFPERPVVADDLAPAAQPEGDPA